MKIKSGLTAVLTAGLLFTGLAAPADAGTTYVTNLRAAVRALPIANENNVGYDRTRYFGGWIDQNRDCQYTRAEVLISETTVAPTYTSSRCTVSAGRWVTSWDKRVHTSPTTVEIDHVVPVAEAWGSGARNWTQARRVAFYNDLGYAGALNAQTITLNRQKVAKGPEEWMPPTNWCMYIAQWTAVKARWGLTVDNAEKAALIYYADRCAPSQLTITKY